MVQLLTNRRQRKIKIDVNSPPPLINNTIVGIFVLLNI